MVAGTLMLTSIGIRLLDGPMGACVKLPYHRHITMPWAHHISAMVAFWLKHDFLTELLLGWGRLTSLIIHSHHVHNLTFLKGWHTQVMTSICICWGNDGHVYALNHVSFVWRQFHISAFWHFIRALIWTITFNISLCHLTLFAMGKNISILWEDTLGLGTSDTNNWVGVNLVDGTTLQVEKL